MFDAFQILSNTTKQSGQTVKWLVTKQCLMLLISYPDLTLSLEICCLSNGPAKKQAAQRQKYLEAAKY